MCCHAPVPRLRFVWHVRAIALCPPRFQWQSQSTVPTSSSTSQPPKPKPKPKKHKQKSQPDKTGDTIPAAENLTHTQNDGAEAGVSLHPTTTPALASAAAVPEGFIHAEYDVKFGEFDYDTLKADDECQALAGLGTKCGASTSLLTPSHHHTRGARCVKVREPNIIYYR